MFLSGTRGPPLQGAFSFFSRSLHPLLACPSPSKPNLQWVPAAAGAGASPRLILLNRHLIPQRHHPALLHIPPSPNPRLLRASPPILLPRHAPHPCVLPALPPAQPHHVLVPQPQQLASPVHTGRWRMLHRSPLLHRPSPLLHRPKEARWLFHNVTSGLRSEKKLQRWSWPG
jgi:hypothetical protein